MKWANIETNVTNFEPTLGQCHTHCGNIDPIQPQYCDAIDSNIILYMNTKNKDKIKDK